MVKTKAETKKFERFKTISGTVESFISDGFSEITSVGEEFREICDNTPENLQSTGIYESRDSTASSIEGFSEPSVSSSILGEVDCSCQIDNGKVYRGRQTQSRACRASNGASQLRAAAEAVRGWLEEHDEIPEADVNDADSMKQRAAFIEDNDIEDVGDYESAREEAEQLASDLEEIADEVDGLEFPGMFG